MRSRIWLSFAFLILTLSLISQKKEGDRYFENQQYSKALKFYNLYEKIDKREKTLMRRAICYYEVNKPGKCLNDLGKLEKMGYKDVSFFKYTALALHSLERYEDAAIFYKKLYRKTKDDKEKDWIKSALRQCFFARNYIYKEALGYAQNLGELVNTKNDEQRIIESKNFPNRIYFSSNRREAFENQFSNEALASNVLETPTHDIFSSTYDQGTWGSVQSFNIFLNTSREEILQDFSEDGRVAFFQSGTNTKDYWLLVDTAKEVKNNIRPSKLFAPINMAAGDRDVHVYNDSLLFFTSNRLGGYGGYDIFFTIRKSDSLWTAPVNLGKNINSRQDEISPFLARNGKKLFFSSNRVNGFGGLDVFESNWENGTWSDAMNMGTGINSTKDDTDFRLSRDGLSAFLTSSRIEGYGNKDVYRINLRNKDNAQLTASSKLEFLDTYVRVEPKRKEEAINFWDTQFQTNQAEIEDNATSNSNEEILKPQKLFKISPLYYDEDEFLRSSENELVLNNLVDIYSKDKKTKFLLISHSIEEDGFVFDLYLSAKRGERMMKEMQKKGIPAENIYLTAVGSNYPLVKQRSEGKNIELANKFNRRFDLLVFPSSTADFEISYVEPDVADFLRDFKYDTFVSATRGLSYRVKVEESTKIVDDLKLRDFQDLIIEKKGKKFRYTLGILKSFEESLELHDILVANGFKNLQIQAYFNNLPLNSNEAEQRITIYPDLKGYIQFTKGE